MPARFSVREARSRFAERFWLFAATVSMALAMTAALAQSSSAAPLPFTFSAQPSSKVAGAHPRLSYSWGTTSPQLARSLSIDLPAGQMLSYGRLAVCAQADLLAQRCPAESAVGQLSGSWQVGSTNANFSTNLFRVADDGAQYGQAWVFAGLLTTTARALTAVRPTITGFAGAGAGGRMFFNLPNLPTSAIVNGAAQPMRATSMTIRVNDTSPGGPLITNPTGCATATTVATTVAANADSGQISSAFTPTRCSSVPFSPSASVLPDATLVAGPPTTFALRLTQPQIDAAIQNSHVRTSDFDLSGLQLDALLFDESVPPCLPGTSTTRADGTIACAADNSIGDLAVSIAGLPSATTGTLHRIRPADASTWVPGHGVTGREQDYWAVAELSLMRRESGTWSTARFLVIADRDNKRVTLSGLPQLPVESLRVGFQRGYIDFDQYCGSSSHFAVSQNSGHSGAQAASTSAVSTSPCSPRPPAITSGPADASVLLPGPVKFEFSSTSGSSSQCSLDNAAFASCSSPVTFDGLTDGPYTFAVRSVTTDGSLSEAVTRTFTVDGTAPAIAIDEPGVHVFDEPPSVRFELFEANPGMTECAVFDSATGALVAGGSSDPNAGCGDSLTRSDGSTCAPADPPDPDCKRTYVIPHVLERSGRYRAVIGHTDAAGNVGSSVFQFELDRDPPSILMTNVRDSDADGDGFADDRWRATSFSVVFDLFDVGSGLESGPTCAYRGWDGTIKGSTRLLDDDGDGIGDVCEVLADSDGDGFVEIAARDRVGHVTIVKRGFTVDNSPPVLTLHSPPDGDDVTCSTAGAAQGRCNVTVKYTLFDSSGDPSSVDFSVNGGEPRPLPATSSSEPQTHTFSLDLRETTTGLDVEYRLAAQDRAGNSARFATKWRVYAPLPARVTIVAPQDGSIVASHGSGGGGGAGGMLVVRYSVEPGANDGPFTGRCLIDGAVVLDPCPSQSQIAVADGQHELTVLVADSTGLEGSDTVVFTVDSAPPAITLDPSMPKSTIEPFFDVFAEIAETNLATITCSSALAGSPGDLVQPCAPDACVITPDPSAPDASEVRCHTTHLRQGLNTLGLHATDKAGNAASTFFDVFVDLSAPEITFVDPRDADSDGDGFADARFRPAFFDVFVELADAGGDLDAEATTCALRGWDGTIKGSAKLIVDRDSGRSRCAIGDATEGDAYVEIAARDYVGHVTIVKRGFAVDATQPIVEILDETPAGQVLTSMPRVRFDVVDAHVGSSVCRLVDSGGIAVHEDEDCDGFYTNTQGEVCDDGDSNGCARTYVIPHVLEKSGRYSVVVTHADAAGNTGTDATSFVLDVDPPQVSLPNFLDSDSDGDLVADQRWRPAFFDVFVEVRDNGTGAEWSCAFKGWDGTIKGRTTLADLDGDGALDACRVAAFSEGDGYVEISATDGGGHVTVLKRGFTIDMTPPAITVNEEGVRYTSDPFFDVFTEFGIRIDGRTQWTPSDGRCVVLTEADLDGDGTFETLGSDGCPGSGELKGEPLFRDGLRLTKVMASDLAGNTSSVSVQFVVDTTPPVVSILEPASVPYLHFPPVQFEVGDPNKGNTACTVIDVAGQIMYTDDDCDGFAKPDGGDCDATGPSDQCKRTFVMPHVLEKSGYYSLSVTHTDSAGNTGTEAVTVYVDRAPPIVVTTDPSDADADGDGVADAPYRQGSFDVALAVSDDSAAVIGSQSLAVLDCRFVDADGSARGAATVWDLDNDGVLDSCRVRDAQEGSGTLEVRARDYVGHVTVVKRTFVVDLTPPQISIDEPGVHLTASSFFDVFTELGVTIDGKRLWTDADGVCTILVEADLDGDGEFEPFSRAACPGQGASSDPGGAGAGGRVALAEGDNLVTVLVYDAANHNSTRSNLVRLDVTNPTVTIEPLERTVYASPPPIRFRVTDDNPQATTCRLVLSNDSSDPDTPCGDSILRADGSSCSADDAASDPTCKRTWAIPHVLEKSGLYRVVVTHTDAVGHTGTSSIAFELDVTPPAIEFTSPADFDADGDQIADSPLRPPTFRVAFKGSDNAGQNENWDFGDCLFRGWDGTIKGKTAVADLDRDGRPDLCTVSEASEGDGWLELSARDHVGHVTVVKRGFTVDATPPVVEIVGSETRWDTDPYVETSMRTLGSIGSPDCELTTATGERIDCADDACVATGQADAAGWSYFSCRTGPATEGENQLTVVVRDAVGNTATDTLTWILDTVAPRVEFVSDGSTSQWPVLLDSFSLHFDVYEEHVGRTVCEVVYLDGSGARDEDIACGDRLTRPDGSDCDDGDAAIDPSCKATFVLPHLIERSGTYRVVVAHTDLAGNTGSASYPFVWDVDPPQVASTDPLDSDDDGDGLADRRKRQSSFSVPFAATDVPAESGVAAGGLSCHLVDGNDTPLSRGSALVVSDPTTGQTRCEISDAPEGPLYVAITARDRGGHVTVLKRGFEVDITAARMAIKTKGTGAQRAGSFFDVFTDLGLEIDGLSGWDLDNDGLWDLDNDGVCLIRLNWDIDNDGAYDFESAHSCTEPFELPQGLVRITIDVTDGAGNASSIAAQVYGDRNPPVLLLHHGRLLSSDATPEVAFGVQDDSLDAGVSMDVFEFSCEVAYSDATSGSLVRARGIIITRPSGGTSSGRCALPELPEGEAEVTLMATDGGGWTAVGRTPLVVDRTAPALAIKTKGVPVQRVGSFFDVFADGGLTIDGSSTWDPDNDPMCVVNYDYDWDFVDTGYRSSRRQSCAEPFPVPAGQVAFTVTIADAAGNAASISGTFHGDGSAPVVRLSHEGRLLTNSDLPTVRFSVTDDSFVVAGALEAMSAGCSITYTDSSSGALVTARGIIRVKPTGGGLSASGDCGFYALPEVNDEVLVSVTDAAGHTTSVTQYLTVDRTAPKLATAATTVAHAAGTQLDAFAALGLTVDGKFAWDLDNDGVCAVRYEWDLDNDGTYETLLDRFCDQAVEVRPGLARVSIRATDLAGNGSSMSMWEFGDGSPPQVIIPHSGHILSSNDSPAVDFAVYEDSLVVAEFADSMAIECTATSVDPATGETRRARGIISIKPAGSNPNGRCQLSGLADGRYTFELRVTDAIGLSASAAAILVVDTTPPSISIDEPGVHYTANEFFDVFTELGVAIDGKNHWTQDDGRCRILHSADVDRDGALDLVATVDCPDGDGSGGGAGGGVLRLLEGDNQITIEVWDAFNQNSSRTNHVRLDSVSPLVSFAAGTPALFGGSPRIEFAVADANRGTTACTLTTVATDVDTSCGDSLVIVGSEVCDDGDPSVTECRFSWEPPTPLVSGNYRLSLLHRDRAGNIGTASLSFAVDSSPPAIAITDGAKFARTGEPFDIFADGGVTIDGVSGWTGAEERCVVTYEWDFDYDGVARHSESGTCTQRPPRIATAGPQRLTIRVSDDAGSSEPELMRVFGDSDAPTVVSTRTSDRFSGGSITSTFHLDDDGLSYNGKPTVLKATCRVSNGALVAHGTFSTLDSDVLDGVDATCEYSGLDAGIWTETVEVTDGAGRVSVLTQEFSSN